MHAPFDLLEFFIAELSGVDVRSALADRQIILLLEIQLDAGHR